jgi:O-antigen/teichoic acid export membrane protein
LIKILKNLLAGWGSTVAIGIIGFIMIPFLLGEMGEARYSLVLVLVAVVGIAQLADLGIGISLSRELSAASAKEERKKFGEFLCSGIAIYLSVGLVGTTIIYFGAPLIVEKMWDGNGSPDLAIRACQIYGAGMLMIGFFNQGWFSLISAYERFDLSSMVIAGISAGSALLHWILIPNAQDKVLTWVIVQVGVQALASILLVFIARHLHGPLHLNFSSLCRKCCRELLGLSSKVSLLKLTTLFSEKTDPLILASYSSPINLVMYNAASRVSTATKPFVSTIAGQLCPRATDVFVKGDIEEVRRILTVGTRYTMIIGGLVLILVALFAHPFSELWLKSSIPNGWSTVASLMIGLAVIEFMTFAAGGTQWSVLFGMKRLNFLVMTMLPAAILNLFLSIWFVGYTEVGVMGVIIATLVISFIRRPVLVWYTARLVGISTKKYFVSSYFKPAVLILAVGGIGFIGRSYWVPGTWIELIASVSIITILWGMLAYLFGVSEYEKKGIKEGLVGAISKLKNTT